VWGSTGAARLRGNRRGKRGAHAADHPTPAVQLLTLGIKGKSHENVKIIKIGLIPPYCVGLGQPGEGLGRVGGGTVRGGCPPPSLARCFLTLDST